MSDYIDYAHLNCITKRTQIMIGTPGALAIVALLIKLGSIVGLAVAVVMAVRALRKSAREQARIADQLEEIQRELKR
ncbi:MULTISPECIES: hypothetical protein [unclassified Marinimicrobium]|jgi:hypothetical protein|uniref:hypothetical protein n=1 Tax=unclassified Marinimicrobium TaxID=2632100 RepID=UPI00257C1793|nr:MULTISPECIES: hypothetical protein [unclassified Marinimicrobium]